MDIARPEFKTQKRRRQLFILAAVILAVAAVSVGVSRLKAGGTARWIAAPCGPTP